MGLFPVSGIVMVGRGMKFPQVSGKAMVGRDLGISQVAGIVTAGRGTISPARNDKQKVSQRVLKDP